MFTLLRLYTCLSRVFLAGTGRNPLRFPTSSWAFSPGVVTAWLSLDSCLTSSRGFAEVLTSVGSASAPSGVLTLGGFTLGLGFTSHGCFFLCSVVYLRNFSHHGCPCFLLLEKQLRSVHLKLSLLCFMPSTNFWFCQKLVAGFMIFENRSLTKEGNALLEVACAAAGHFKHS